MKISILGCGWLGLPLGRFWLDKGYQVKGSTTRESQFEKLVQAGIDSYTINLSEEGIQGDFSGFIKDAEVLVVAIPPGLRKTNPENFTDKIKFLLPKIKQSPLQKLIFVSSTSVYGDHQGEVDEETIPEPDTESGRQLCTTEELLLKLDHPSICVVRLGGLLGPDRHPVTFLSGRKELSSPKSPINLIQQQEVIEIIDFLIEFETLPKRVNAVFPEHPEKATYYANEAQKRGLPIPEFNVSDTTVGKCVHSMVLTQLGYSFTYAI